MYELSFRVNDADSEKRLDKLIADEIDSLSRSFTQKLIEDGAVLVNGKYVSKSIKLKAGDTVFVSVPDPVELKATPQNIPLDIVYEDDSVIIVNKPKGMVVHPAPGNLDGTLVNALLYHCKGHLSSINGVIRPGIVHRIDKDTSGLIIAAKTDIAHISLSEQIRERSFKREYRGVVIGAMPRTEGTIDVPLGRSKKDRKKQAPYGLNPRNAITRYQALEHYSGFDYCRFALETGRTHQIRVHSAYIGHPVAGDRVYGPAKNTFGLKGQCLHASDVGFIHPLTHEYLEFSAPLPEYFTEFLARIKE